MDSSEEGRLTDALFAASRSLLAVAARSLVELPPDVTVPQFRVLVVLSTRGPQRAAALAHELRVAPSSLTRLCDRLSSRGYLERTTAPDSRREVEIRLTEPGAALVDGVTARRRVELKAIVDAIAVEDRVAITDALAKVGSAMSMTDEALTFGWTA